MKNFGVQRLVVEDKNIFDIWRNLSKWSFISVIMGEKILPSNMCSSVWAQFLTKKAWLECLLKGKVKLILKLTLLTDLYSSLVFW